MILYSLLRFLWVILALAPPASYVDILFNGCFFGALLRGNVFKDINFKFGN